MLSNPWTASESGAIAVAFFIYTPPFTSMVVQTGSNTTAVTLNSVGGIIQCMSSTVASGGVVTFTLNNSSIMTNSIVFVSNVGGNNWFVPTVAGAGPGECVLTFYNSWSQAQEVGVIDIAFYVSTSTSQGPQAPPQSLIMIAAAVQQTGTINTAVSLNAQAGVIVPIKTSLSNGMGGSFTLNNTFINPNSVILVGIYGTFVNVSVNSIVNGSCSIMALNIWSGGSPTSESVGEISFFII